MHNQKSRIKYHFAMKKECLSGSTITLAAPVQNVLCINNGKHQQHEKRQSQSLVSYENPFLLYEYRPRGQRNLGK
jgi:hypothetical protein